MQPEYLHLAPGDVPPEIDSIAFLAILIAEVPVSSGWRDQISQWLVTRGCLYAVAWGVDCEIWHDNVDEAVLELHGYGDIPDEHFVMTTWHSAEPLSEALWFAGNCASHPDVKLRRAIIVHIAAVNERDRILNAYQAAQEMTGA